MAALTAADATRRLADDEEGPTSGESWHKKG
jgi:hypothetical protein